MNPKNSLSYHLDHSDHSVGGIMMQLYAATAADLLKAGIDINVPLKTIDGDAIRLIAYDGDHRYPIVGEVIDEGAGVAWLARWSRAGRYFGTPEATKKHSMAVSVMVKDIKLDLETGRFSGVASNPSGSLRGCVIDEVSSFPPCFDKLRTMKDSPPQVEPVHDMGLEEKPRFVPIQTAAQEFDTLANLRVQLNYYKNASPPDVESGPATVKISKQIAGNHDGMTRRPHAYAKLLTYAAFGRFRWYALENQDIPLDCAEKIVKVLDETDLPFVYLRSPDVARYPEGSNPHKEFVAAVRFAAKQGGVDAVLESMRASAE